MHPTIRTSATHPLQIAEVPLPTGGAVGLTFCPGKCAPSLYGHSWQRDLGADLDAIRAWGAAYLVTLVEQHELHSLKVERLGEEVATRGIKWLHLPIVDVSTPSAEFESQWKRVASALTKQLTEGGKVLVHCKGGLGRAGTIASVLLIEMGQSPDVAIGTVRAVRPGAVETPSQELYVKRYKPFTGASA
jgi:ADP-ribosyl-[dinitrogen reductase] hydrolase